MLCCSDDAYVMDTRRYVETGSRSYERYAQAEQGLSWRLGRQMGDTSPARALYAMITRLDRRQTKVVDK